MKFRFLILCKILITSCLLFSNRLASGIQSINISKQSSKFDSLSQRTVLKSPAWGSGMPLYHGHFMLAFSGFLLHMTVLITI